MPSYGMFLVLDLKVMGKIIQTPIMVKDCLPKIAYGLAIFKEREKSSDKGSDKICRVMNELSDAGLVAAPYLKEGSLSVWIWEGRSIFSLEGILQILMEKNISVCLVMREEGV